MFNFILLTVLMFITAETISKFGSGLFLLVQVVLLLDFVHGWNEKWVKKDEQFWFVELFSLYLFLSAIWNLNHLTNVVFALYTYDCSFFDAVSGMWRCLLSHLLVMWWHFPSPGCSSIGLLRRDMIVVSTPLSSSWLWFLSLFLQLLHFIQP